MLKDLRDLAVLLVGRDLLARANELVQLTHEAVQFQENGTALVRMRRCKAETRTSTYPLGAEAVDALRRWLVAAGVNEGPLFRALSKASKDRDGRVKEAAIGVRDVGRIVKRLAGEAYSAHSLRVGMAQDLAAENFELPAIMQAGGWRSPQMVARYTEKQEAGRSAVAKYHARRHK
jgi:integrase